MADDPRRQEPGSCQVYAPIRKIDKCAVCLKHQKKLMLCGRCKNRVYCSGQCQTSDWALHKPNCFKPHFLDLTVFHACLAGYAENVRRRSNRRAPLPLRRCIKGHTVEQLPSGVHILTLELDKDLPVPDEYDFERDWWPNVPSRTVLWRTRRRVQEAGDVLALHLGAAIGILTEIYTTSGKDTQRLSYHGSPIADFGVARGRFRMDRRGDYTCNVLAYRDSRDPEGKVIKLQDPDDHYWLYFRTLHGEEHICDFSMYTFNMPLVVATELGIIVPQHYRDAPGGPIENAPVQFLQRGMVPFTEWWEEEARYSVLHDPVLQRCAVNYFAAWQQKPEDMLSQEDFARKVSRQPLTKEDVDAFNYAVGWNRWEVYSLCGPGQEQWKKLPREAARGAEGSPEGLEEELQALGFNVRW